MLQLRNPDRRKIMSKAFRFRQPFFMQVPRPLAASVLAGLALITILASHAAAPAVRFAPFFLLICAFGAWYVGNRFAVSLGLFIAAIQVLSGHADLRQAPALLVGLQIACALAVILMLGVARAALEIEWRFARTDSLTGALNRKAFFEIVAREDTRSGIIVLIYADVNGLKETNDRLGHEAGDSALRAFADRVRRAVRKTDVFARIGGDEFVIFLRVRDLVAAKLVAQRLHETLNLSDDPEDHAKVTCSLGVLVLPAGSKSIDTELRQADSLMYHAKRDKAGFMMAVSVRGDLQELIAYAPATNPDGQQRAVVRLNERIEGSLPSQGPPITPSVH